MITQTIQDFYPVNESDLAKLGEIMAEITKAVMTRSDGVEIVIERDDQFPPMDGKALISKVQIKCWDISA